MSSSDVSPDTLHSWLQTIDEQLAAVADRMQPLLEERASLNERRTLVQGLLTSVSGVAASSQTNAPHGESVRERVHRQAVEVLTAAGTPLHINALHAEFVKRGFVIPGLGQTANISVHLANWPDVVSPARGMYALTSVAGDVAPRPRPTKATKRKARR